MRIEKELRFKSGWQYYLQDGNIIYCVTYWDEGHISVRRTRVLKTYKIYMTIDHLINSRKSITIFRMEKQERIDKIYATPPGSLFFIQKPNGLYWKSDDQGYTSDINGARKWTKEEIIEKLEGNGLIDKKIEVFNHSITI